MDTITEARRFAKQKRKNGNKDKCDIKIAVIGTASIQYFVIVLDYMLHDAGINADIYEGGYNGVTMDVFDDKSPLFKFNPNLVIVLTHYTDIKVFPEILEENTSIDGRVEDTLAYYRSVWNNISRISGVHILQSNFVIPPEHLLGNLESAVAYSKTSFYRRINTKLIENSPKNVSIIDVELISQYVGKYNWFDYKAYFIGKIAYKMDYLPAVVDLFVKQILCQKGKIKKCLVLDLDNTLWGGVVGDEGYDGVQIDPNNAVGEAYRYFQSYILDLKRRGVILAVCSKNDENNAKEPFERNSNMILRLDDISCFMANWDDKVTNIKRIAETLNIGLDSFVFFDDNPAEREIVKNYLPEVCVVDVPQDPALYALQLDKENPFNWTQFTKEDVARSNTYIENRHRQELVTQFKNYDEYLLALEMVGKVGLVSDREVPRFTQLLNKSNQFNLRTQRYSENQISDFIANEETNCIYVSLKDKFSEYGIIACVILRKQNKVCFIDSWVMSCRVLKRNVEGLTFKRIIQGAKNLGCGVIRAEYIRSKKNGMVAEFYDSLGFDCIEDNDDFKIYEYNVIENVYREKIHITEES